MPFLYCSELRCNVHETENCALNYSIDTKRIGSQARNITYGRQDFNLELERRKAVAQISYPASIEKGLQLDGELLKILVKKAGSMASWDSEGGIRISCEPR